MTDFTGFKPSVVQKYAATTTVPGMKVPVSRGSIVYGSSKSSPIILSDRSGGGGQGFSAAPVTPYSPSSVNLAGSGQSLQLDVNVDRRGGGGDYSLSDAELFNAQLENAYLMQQLGYDVDFRGGEMIYSRTYQPQVSQYGGYGTQSSPLIYESDWLQQQTGQPQYQTSPGYYPGYQSYQQGRPYYPGNRGYYNNYGNNYYPSQKGYWRNGYYNRYYSNYGQRYGYYQNNNYPYRRQYRRYGGENYADRYYR